MQAPSGKILQEPFTQYQKFVIAMLTFLQFTIVLDFMVLSPLGAILMPALNVTTQQFGMVVSVYAFSAGIAGFLAGGFADKFDRKKLLMFFYVGFIVGTLLCAIATNYLFLMFARLVTGLFGGVIGSIVFAIITDLFPFEQRGRVMGFVQTSFAASQVLGIPLSLYLSTIWGWHSPFVLIVGIGIFAGIVIAVYLKPIDSHLKLQTVGKPFAHLVETMTNMRYLQAFATTALLSTGGYMLMPFGSAFLVKNLETAVERLPVVYIITGAASIFMGPIIGRISDRIGKFPMFMTGSLITIVLVAYHTRMGPSPLWLVILVSVIMFTGIFSRMIPSQALMSAIPEPRSRGSFMAVSSSIQQISGGVASALAGMIVYEGATGKIENFDVLGNVVIGAILITLFMMWRINKLIQRTGTR